MVILAFVLFGGGAFISGWALSQAMKNEELKVLREDNMRLSARAYISQSWREKAMIYLREIHKLQLALGRRQRKIFRMKRTISNIKAEIATLQGYQGGAQYLDQELPLLRDQIVGSQSPPVLSADASRNTGT
jgi:hypothetical protein